MIIVDSSALVAILEHEADAAIYADAAVKADRWSFTDPGSI
jgi:uncharacterized protein with PIN domain